MRFDQFIGPSYRAQAYTLDQEHTVNWYLENSQSEGASSPAALYPTPGVNLLSTAVSGAGRCNWFQNGRQFAVLGTALVEIDSNGNQTVRGTVAIDGNPATISSNGDGGGQLFITSGTNGYNYELATNTLTQIAALNGIATMGGYIDGYFLVLDANTSTFYISDLLDGTTWDPTQFAQRSLASDPWVALKVAGRNVWLIGEQTSEVWYNSGASPFPFAANPSSLITFGTTSPWSVAVLGREIIWLGQSKDGRANILRASGFTPDIISNYAIQNAISEYGVIEDAIGDTWSDRGHNFYYVTFPSADFTWCWDSETSQWFQLGTWIEEDGEYTSWRPRWHAFAFNQHRMLDGETGAVYHMDVSFNTDADERVIRRLRRAPALVNELERIRYSKFELDMQPALGTGSGQAENPVAMMRFSNDGGKTWSAEQWREIGRVGEYDKRVEWWRLGQARRRVFEVSVTDPVGYKLTACYLSTDAQQGAA